VDITGTTAAANYLAILGKTAEQIAKLDRSWASWFEPDNSAGPAIGQATVYASDPGGGTGGADLIRIELPLWLVPKREQVITYDLDGNLKNDGMWVYTYNAENQLVRMVSAVAHLNGIL